MERFVICTVHKMEACRCDKIKVNEKAVHVARSGQKSGSYRVVIENLRRRQILKSLTASEDEIKNGSD
jgi:hypothetical protein